MAMSDRQRRIAQESLKPTSKHEQLLGKLREIGFGPGDLDTRVQAALAAVGGERDRFPVSDAGQIQWNWYMGKFATEIRYERDQLELSSRKQTTNPGEPAPGRLLEFFVTLQPQILGLKESSEESISITLGTKAKAGG
jgi:hypothetical protein